VRREIPRPTVTATPIGKARTATSGRGHINWTIECIALALYPPLLFCSRSSPFSSRRLASYPKAQRRGRQSRTRRVPNGVFTSSSMPGTQRRWRRVVPLRGRCVCAKPMPFHRAQTAELLRAKGYVVTLPRARIPRWARRCQPRWAELRRPAGRGRYGERRRAVLFLSLHHNGSGNAGRRARGLCCAERAFAGANRLSPNWCRQTFCGDC
jgi:hypothetical protein